MRRISQGLKTTLGRTRVFSGFACLSEGIPLPRLALPWDNVGSFAPASCDDPDHNVSQSERGRNIQATGGGAHHCQNNPCLQQIGHSVSGRTDNRQGWRHSYLHRRRQPLQRRLADYLHLASHGADPQNPHRLQAHRYHRICWPISGSQHVTVTALNCLVASATDSLIINIEQWHTYLPLALKRYLYDPHEPNDTRGQAYGPLVSGQTYIGFFPDAVDRNDYYKIDIFTKEKVSAQLGCPIGSI